MIIDTWSHQIYQAISHKNVFLTGIYNKQTLIINNHAGNKGYKALLVLIYPAHPNYSTYPTAALRDQPRQRKKEALQAYFYRYIDYV